MPDVTSPPPPKGVAIVLPVPADVAARVALPDGLPASELHVTLAYLSTFPADDSAAYTRLRAAVAVWALLGCAPLPATLGGVGRFTGSVEEGDAFHLTADVPGLPAIRETLVKVLAAQGFEVSTAHGFSPHVTLAYLAPDAPSPLDRVDPVPLVFDRVSIWQGAHHNDVLFRPPPVTTLHRALTPTAYGAAVALSVLPTDGVGGPWCVLAYEVELKGYRFADGTHAKITTADLDQMVANFARYPKVPLVFEHADTRKEVAEIHPEWATPKGYVVALRKGTMARAVDGAVKTVATLEGRLDVSEDMRLAIVGDPEKGVVAQWPFCSVTTATGIDEESGAALGTVLWSVSLTAHPRLKDLPRLAAGKEITMPAKKTDTPLAPRTELSCWYGEIKTRDDVLAMLRHCLNLPVSTTEAEVLAALDAAVALAATDGSVGDAIEDVREAMRLPVVNPDGTAPDLGGEVRKALTALSSSASNTEMSRGAPAAPTAPKEGTTMKTFTELAAEMKLSAVTSEEAARAQIVALARDGAATRSALKLTLDAPLAPSLAEVATDRAELAQVKAAHATATAELAQIKDAAEKARKEAAEKALHTHVDAVALAKGWDDDTKALVFAGALADPEAFAAKYPAPSVQELAQRAQDGARFGRLPTAPNPPASSADPGAAPDLAADIAQIKSFALRAGYELDDLEASAIAFRATPAEYAKSLGLQPSA